MQKHMHSDKPHDISLDNKHRSADDFSKLKRDMDEAEEIFYKEISSKYFLLDKLTEDQLKKMCIDLLGKGPDREYFQDEHSGKVIELPHYKEDYIHFIIDEFPFSEIKNYALSKGIVTSKFFEK